MLPKCRRIHLLSLRYGLVLAPLLSWLCTILLLHLVVNPIMAPDRGRFDRWWFDLGLTLLTVRLLPAFRPFLHTRKDRVPDIKQLAGGYYTFKYLLTQINFDPDSEQKEQARIKSAAILRRLDTPRAEENDADSETHGEPQARPRKEDLKLNQYEQAILQDLVLADDINVSFDDIGGLSHIIEELREAVIYPLTMPNLYYGSSSLLSAPSGVLLYGPPGCVSPAPQSSFDLY